VGTVLGTAIIWASSLPTIRLLTRFYATLFSTEVVGQSTCWSNRDWMVALEGEWVQYSSPNVLGVETSDVGSNIPFLLFCCTR